jgi:hypothetical protein
MIQANRALEPEQTRSGGQAVREIYFWRVAQQRLSLVCGSGGAT